LDGSPTRAWKDHALLDEYSAFDVDKKEAIGWKK